MGDNFTLDGIEFRVVLGEKETPDELEQDLRLEHRVGGRWHQTAMALPFMMADFFCENESILYPVVNGNAGGKRFLYSCNRAGKDGWREAVKWLEYDKQLKRSAA